MAASGITRREHLSKQANKKPEAPRSLPAFGSTMDQSNCSMISSGMSALW